MTFTYDNPAAKYLFDLGLISNDLELVSDSCRDAPVRVLKCRASGIFFLETAAQTADDYYSQKPHSSLSVHQGPPTIEEQDLSRRQRLLNRYLAGRRWVDLGAGFGALVEREMASGTASSLLAVEPNVIQRREMESRNIPCVSDISLIDVEEEQSFGIATMFHVLEHIHDLKAFLSSTRRILHENGLLIVEVPHARDVLLETYQSPAFKDFTFWSEHLILHTEKSLVAVLEDNGFIVTNLERVQRYPITNHLRWLSHGRPGGQEEYAHLQSEALQDAYDAILRKLNQTDSLVAIARKAQTFQED